MRGMTWRALAALLAVVVTVVVAALTRLPYEATGGEDAMIRLSWRTTGEFVEECRRLSEEELAQLPVHMRREEVCERRAIPYRLRVLIDGRLAHEERVEPAGARRDRPLYVFEELTVAPGEYRVEVSWEPEAEAGALRVARQDTLPAALALQATLRLEPGDIALVTYDPDRRVFTARGRGVVASGPP